MKKSTRRRLIPFAVLAAVVAIVSVAMIRLPESFVAQLERNRVFTSSQAGWAYRLLAFAAVAQALYGGFAVLRTERVRRSREEDPKVAPLSKDDIVKSLARGAAGMAGLTLVYGIASFVITGQRGGFWLFPVILVAQAGWYYRLVWEIERWLTLQPAPVSPPAPDRRWRQGPPDYCPPIARGLGAPGPGDSG